MSTTTLTVEQALAAVGAAAGGPRRRSESVPLVAALGRVLAQDVAMDHAVPPFRRAAMDGYAVSDMGAAGASYRVAGRVMAGDEAPSRLESGSALRVMTGAPVPADARAVLPFEWTREADGRTLVERRPGADTHIVEVGAHVAAGERVLCAGVRLDAGAVGVLATAGVSQVPVARRVRVAVLATGTELVSVASRPGPAQIRNSNNPTLLAQATAAGGEAFDLGVVADDPAALRAALRQGLEHDLLLVSGGVSRGDLDLVPAALVQEGVEPVFHGWRVQPGGPLWFGRRGDTLVFALPGNPAASFVGFELLGVPALQTRLGRAFAPRRSFVAAWDGPAPGAYSRRRYRPARLASAADGGLCAQPSAWKGSGDPFAWAGAEALAELPEAGLAADGSGGVRVFPLGPFA